VSIAWAPGDPQNRNTPHDTPGATDMTTTRRIYVQNYATYNEGRLDGQWYDLEDYADADALHAAIKANNRADAEEFGLFDYEGFMGLVSEYTHYSKAFEIHELLESCDDLDQLEAFYDAFGAEYCSLEEAIEQCADKHAGTADSEKEFAENYAVDAGFIPDSFPDGSPFRYIDFQWYWDGELRFSFVTGRDDSGTLHFFAND
jgi:antirestriction protein